MNTVLRKHFAVAIVLFFCLHPLSAQNKKLFNGKRHRIGCIVGVGGQDLNQLTKLTYSEEVGLDVTYNYRVMFFQAQYYYALLRRKTWGIDVLAQPQYNTTRFRPLDNRGEEVRGCEFGLNGGVLIRKNFFQRFLESLCPDFVRTALCLRSGNRAASFSRTTFLSA